MSTTHTIPADALEPDRYGETGHWDTPHFGPRLRLIMKGSPQTPGFAVGYVDDTGEARRETGGPIVPGPYAYAYGLAGVIDNCGGTGREIEEARQAALLFHIKAGDRLVMPDGETFEVDFARCAGRVDDHNITLTHVTGEAS